MAAMSESLDVQGAAAGRYSEDVGLDVWLRMRG